MSTKTNDNWLNQLRSLMQNNRKEGRLLSDEEISSNDEVRVQLRKKMAKEVMDARMRQATYGYLQMI